MKYLGYALIFVAMAGGYIGFHSGLIVVLALISTFIYASARKKDLKSQPQTPDQSLWLDRAYLLAGQSLIMFVAYILGWFFANRVALGAG